MIVDESEPVAPVSLAAVKAHLRLTSAGADARLIPLMTAATSLCERFIGAPLIARTMTEDLARPCGWVRLSRAPVRSIDAVAAVASDGGVTPLPSEGYALDIDRAGRGRVVVHAAPAGVRVRVTYSAGLAADASGVAAPLAQGIVRMVEHLHRERDGGTATQDAPPAIVAALWAPWRRWSIGA